MTLRPRPLHLPGRRRPLGVADLTFLPALPRVVCRNVKSKSHTRIIWLLVSLWFRRLYESVLQNDTNVGTGTLGACPSNRFDRFRREFDSAKSVIRSQSFHCSHRSAYK